MGISAPQGCGKTTIVEQLHNLFEAEGARAASVSIDDYYLTVRAITSFRPPLPPPHIPALLRAHPPATRKRLRLAWIDLTLLTAGAAPPAAALHTAQGADQDKLAKSNGDNALLKFRGNAGSHDLSLAKGNLGAQRLRSAARSCAGPLLRLCLRGGGAG